MKGKRRIEDALVTKPTLNEDKADDCCPFPLVLCGKESISKRFVHFHHGTMQIAILLN